MIILRQNNYQVSLAAYLFEIKRDIALNFPNIIYKC